MFRKDKHQYTSKIQKKLGLSLRYKMTPVQRTANRIKAFAQLLRGSSAFRKQRTSAGRSSDFHIALFVVVVIAVVELVRCLRPGVVVLRPSLIRISIISALVAQQV